MKKRNNLISWACVAVIAASLPLSADANAMNSHPVPATDLTASPLEQSFKIPASSSEVEDSLDEMFIAPPQIAKPQVWWHWIYGNISKDGITKDLEMMNQLGIGGVTQFHNAFDGKWRKRPASPRGPIRFMSKEYREMVKYSLEECHRLDMTMGLQICDGFSQTGGPWVKPETGMRALRHTKIPAQGGQEFNCETPDNTVLILACPGSIKSLTPPIPPKKRGARRRIIKADPQNPMIDPDSPYLTKGLTAIKSREFIDLTSRLQQDGSLNWTVPPGDWTVLVFHHTLHKATNHPASPEGKGLECNKLESDAVDLVFDNYVKLLIDDAGDLAGKTLRHVLIDSWECGYQSWTEGFAEEFKKRRGYDPTPYLPALAMIPVESVELSNRFLCDFRVTLDDLVCEAYYGHLRERLNKKGMQLHAEVLYGWHQMFGNPIRQYGMVDVPMNEIWMNRKIAPMERAYTGYAAAAGHVYGKNIIKDESFTIGAAQGNFSYVPSDMKTRADFILCRGTTKFVLHTSTHQPDDSKPGWTHGWNGVNFHRGNTWWPFADSFVDYLGRCSTMLQQGLFVADVCRYVGQEDTYSAGYGEMPLADLPEGYRADHCDNKVLLERMDVKDGRIVLPDGMSYAVLLLADKKTMAPEVLEKLTELVRKGATVIGPKPESAPGLTGYPECDATVRQLADTLWGNCDGKTITESTFGKGRVVWGKTLADLLKETQLQPDFSYQTTPDQNAINFVHRKLPDADLYFVATAGEACIADCWFRITGKQPELFDPMTGKISDIAVYEEIEGRTRIPLDFEAQGSKIIVFRKNSNDHIVELKHGGVEVFASGASLTKAFSTLPEFKLNSDNSISVAQDQATGDIEYRMRSGKQGKVSGSTPANAIELTGSWSVDFGPGRGAPAQITVLELASWTEHTDSGVRYFSGVGTYNKVFTLPDDFLKKNTRISLDLGDVKELAEVLVNGKSAGTLWRSPYVIDITAHVQAGKNDLTIKVVNTWVNRLIGDKNVPKDEGICQVVSPDPWWFKANSPLPSSGLLGPVFIRASEVRMAPLK